MHDHHDLHDHHDDCAHGAHGAHDASRAPRAVPFDDAERIDSARRLLADSFGEPIEPGDVPPMTIETADVPAGARPLELAQVTASFRPDEPATRARFGTHLSGTIGIPRMGIRHDAEDGWWTWELGVRTRLELAMVATAWRSLAAFPGLAHLRMEGLDRDGLWIMDTPPDPEDAGPRFTRVGPGPIPQAVPA